MNAAELEGHLHARSAQLEQGGARLTHSGLVGVAVRRVRPHTLGVEVVRVSDESESAADVVVFAALETVVGRVTQLEGIMRGRWRAWPLTLVEE